MSMQHELAFQQFCVENGLDYEAFEGSERGHWGFGVSFEASDYEKYAIMDEDEADDAWDASLENFLEECILLELPENLVEYFDSEKWKRDARYDGRGLTLSSYDGVEHEIRTEDGEYFYIYRTN
jgi:hypothetical protein